MNEIMILKCLLLREHKLSSANEIQLNNMKMQRDKALCKDRFREIRILYLYTVLKTSHAFRDNDQCHFSVLMQFS
jgi:hypothetical protein